MPVHVAAVLVYTRTRLTQKERYSRSIFNTRINIRFVLYVVSPQQFVV